MESVVVFVTDCHSTNEHLPHQSRRIYKPITCPYVVCCDYTIMPEARLSSFPHAILHNAPAAFVIRTCDEIVLYQL